MKSTRLKKIDFVGHVQKRLRNTKTTDMGPKLSDGKTIGGNVWLTNKLIDTLQNYYGLAIRNIKVNLTDMMQAVKHPCSRIVQWMFNFLTPGESSWYKYQRSKALGIGVSMEKIQFPSQY